MPGKRYGGGIRRVGWEKLRMAALRRARFRCEVCARRGVDSVAVEVDHIKPRAQDGMHGLDNLQAICKLCHDKKSAIESRLAFRRWVSRGRPTG